MYYNLDGDVFRKIPIDIDGKRVCDIQSARCGVVGPGSIINRCKYSVRDDEVEIAWITPEKIKEIFGLEYLRKVVPARHSKPRPIVEKRTITALEKLGVKRTHGELYKCPFHDMSGKGNLCVLDTGRIYCFHEEKCWEYIDFERDFKNIGKKKIIKKIRECEY